MSNTNAEWLGIAIGVLLWIASGIASGNVAAKRGGRRYLWVLAGLLLGPFGLYLAILFAGENVVCNYCEKPIHPAATTCPHCKANFRGSVDDTRRPFFAGVGKGIIVLSVYAIAVSIYHLSFPEIDLKMSTAETDVVQGELNLVNFKLTNGAFIDLKDPVVACDMNGPSGTTIRTATKVLYELLPAGETRVFSFVPMGAIPEQATTFRCSVKHASLKWPGGRYLGASAER